MTEYHHLKQSGLPFILTHQSMRENEYGKSVLYKVCLFLLF